MSLEAGVPGDKRTPEAWQMICCRYFVAGQLASGKQVLEIGCGSGRGLGYLSARAQRVIGGDYSPENLGYAREHYKDKAELLVLDAQSLPFGNSSFDIIVVMEVVQYLTHIDDFLKECHRVLRGDGILCLCLPNRDAPGFSASPLGYRYYSVPELFELLNGNHFDMPRLFGAFPITRGVALERIRIRVILVGSKALDIVPGGKKIKEFLNETVLGQTIVTKLEIEGGDMIPDNYKLQPLSVDSPDKRHKILYAIAQAKLVLHK
jgi:SAM-dependent methyltransferase